MYLFNKTLITLRANLILSLISCVILSGCFDTGENQGSNLLTINGSLLKGSIRNADISIYDQQGRVIWQGKSDQQGNYNAELFSNKDQLYTVIARITQQSSMVCDAIECIAPLSGNSFVFGDVMPGSELGDIAIKSAIYLNKPNNDPTQNNKSLQINSVSSLIVDVVNRDITTNTNEQDYNNIVQAACGVIENALGITLNENIDILNSALPDITQSNSTATKTDDENTLGVINAGQSSSITRLNQFSDALVTLTTLPDDSQAQAILDETQRKILLEAQALIDDPNINIYSQTLADSINQARANGINFAALEQSISTLNVVSAQANQTSTPLAYTSSTTEYGGAVNQASAQRPGQWWWASDTTNNQTQWISLEYPTAFVPHRIELAIHSQYNHEVILQSSSDNQQWQDVLNLAPFFSTNTNNNHHIKTLDLSLTQWTDLINPSSFYRLYFPTGHQIWIEYWCLSQTLTRTKPLPINHCQNNESPINSDYSSLALTPNNVQNPNKDTWWISELATGTPQWLTIEYQQAFIATQASVTVKTENLGNSPRLQASNDGIEWIELTQITSSSYPGELLDQQGFRQFDLSFSNSQSYRFYRYYAQPSSFIWLAYLSFNGN